MERQVVFRSSDLPADQFSAVHPIHLRIGQTKESYWQNQRSAHRGATLSKSVRTSATRKSSRYNLSCNELDEDCWRLDSSTGSAFLLIIQTQSNLFEPNDLGGLTVLKGRSTFALFQGGKGQHVHSGRIPVATFLRFRLQPSWSRSAGSLMIHRMRRLAIEPLEERFLPASTAVRPVG